MGGFIALVAALRLCRMGSTPGTAAVAFLINVGLVAGTLFRQQAFAVLGMVLLGIGATWPMTAHASTLPEREHLVLVGFLPLASVGVMARSAVGLSSIFLCSILAKLCECFPSITFGTVLLHIVLHNNHMLFCHIL